MADISALGNLQPVQPLDMSEYKGNKESTFRLPAKGRYTLRAPESCPSESFTRTKKSNALSVRIDPTIVGPEHEGFQIRYTNVSATTFQRGGKTVSQLGDYLKACGIVGTLKDEQALADAAESTANAIYQADIDWRVWDKETGFQLEGMEKFPQREDGTYQSWVDHPSKKDENDKPVRLRANLTVKRFIAAE